RSARLLASARGDGASPRALALFRDRALAVLMGDGSIRIRALEGLRLLLTVRPARDGSGSFAIAPEGSVELFGDEAFAPARLACPAGPRRLLFELCEARFLTPGLASRVPALGVRPP